MENKEKVNCPECDKYFASKYTLGVHKLRKHNRNTPALPNPERPASLNPERPTSLSHLNKVNNNTVGEDYVVKDYVDKKITKVRHDVAEFIDLREDLDNIRDESEERDDFLNKNIFIACDKIYRVLERISEHLKIDISDITTSNYKESEDEEEIK